MSPGLPMSPSQADGCCYYVSATRSPARRAPGGSRSGRFGPLLMMLGRLKRSEQGTRMSAPTWRVFHSPRAVRRSGSRSFAGTIEVYAGAARRIARGKGVAMGLYVHRSETAHDSTGCGTKSNGQHRHRVRTMAITNRHT